MRKYKFEIQNLIEVVIGGEDADEARCFLIDNLQNYADDMVDASCYVSDGEEVDDN